MSLQSFRKNINIFKMFANSTTAVEILFAINIDRCIRFHDKKYQICDFILKECQLKIWDQRETLRFGVLMECCKFDREMTVDWCIVEGAS